MKLPTPKKTSKPRRIFSKRSLIKLVTVMAVLVFIGSAWAWWHNIRNNPERVFWNAMGNALSVKSVTRQMDRNTDTGEPDQLLRMTASPTLAATGVNKYYQSGDREEPTLITETIGTLQADYIRVLALKSTEAGKPDPDISEVQGKWADATSPGASDQSGQLLAQFALSIVPFGNLSQSQRNDLVAMMQETDVYEPSFSTVKRTNHNGRPVYSYSVSIKTQEYVVMLKQFAKDMGLTQLDDVDPALYKDTRPLQFTFTVDVLSQQLVGTQPAGDVVTHYVAQGMTSPIIAAPKDTVPLSELQQKLQSLQ